MLWYIDPIPNDSGAYSPPQSTPFDGAIPLTDEQVEAFLQYNGFVTISMEPDPGMEGSTVTVTPNLEAWETWKECQPPEIPTYILSPEQSANAMMAYMFQAQAGNMEDEAVLKCSGLAEEWTPGDHKVGEIYNTGGEQTWECYQAYDNAVYPDIRPGEAAWYTFNRPLHGKSPETARPFVPVQGAHDTYKAGEYMIYTDNKLYKCLSETNFSPDDYAQAWEVQDAGVQRMSNGDSN